MVRCAPNGALFMYIKNIFAESINNSCDDGDLTGEGEILTKLGIRTRDEWNSGARLEQAWQITQIGAGMANWSRRGRLPRLRSAFGAGVAWQAWQKTQSEGLLFHKIKERKHEVDRSCERLGWELA